jgi:hypothetical protein
MGIFSMILKSLIFNGLGVSESRRQDSRIKRRRGEFIGGEELGTGCSKDGLGLEVPATIGKRKIRRCGAASPYRQKRQDFKKQDSREEAASSLSSLETEN